MNFFELFGLPIGFQVDTNKLRAAFMDIQRASHPDKFTQDSPDAQEEALERSAIANKAFTLLNNKELVLPYVLETMGYIEPDEKYTLSPDFLMEMMELNEGWMDADTTEEKENILSQIKTLQNEIISPIKAYLDSDSINSIPEKAMLQIKEYYYKKKYLDRILAEFHH
jgi:molecular chaperone HscB